MNTIKEEKILELQKITEEMVQEAILDYNLEHPKTCMHGYSDHFSKSFVDTDDDNVYVIVFIKNINFKHKSKPPKYLLTEVQYNLEAVTIKEIYKKVREFKNTIWIHYFKGTNKGYKKYLDYFDEELDV